MIKSIVMLLYIFMHLLLNIIECMDMTFLMQFYDKIVNIWADVEF